MKQRLINHIQSVTDSSLRRTCESILTYDKFFTWPASLSHHHAYEGGLLAHTVEVCDLALHSYVALRPDYASEICTRFAKDTAYITPPNRDILIAAALWHDVMKTEEYHVQDWRGVKQATLDRIRHLTKRCDINNFEVWIKDEARVKMFGHHEHIIAGAMEFSKVASWHVSNSDTIDAVTHCILAHHGRKEWGSPVEPQTIEALILHQADMLSARYGATKEVAL